MNPGERIVYDATVGSDRYVMGPGEPEYANWLTSCFCGADYRGLICPGCGRSSLPPGVKS